VVIRTWKRDGSTNRMELDVAVLALASKSRDTTLPVSTKPMQRRHAVRMRLRNGRRVETPRAVFQLER
jgi:hypothetical protein